MDFEQALLGEGTVLLREGPDLQSLGVETSPSPSPRHYSTPSTMSQSSRITTREGQPSTPTIVPPTPSPSNIAPKISLTRSRSPSGTSASSHERYFDVEDDDVQTKRRSIFRSPGTASSPDLATLVRKAKERSAAKQTDMKVNETSKNDVGATPNQHSNSTRESFQRNRQRSSTTVNHSGPPSTSTHRARLTKGQRSGEGGGAVPTPISSDWVVPGPINRLGTVANKGKSTMRSKTSAFLGKIIQGSLRNRTELFSPTTPVTPSYSSSSFYESDAPPVPPIPRNHQTPMAASDIFSDPPNTPDLSKPLPPIQPSPQKHQSLELVSDEDDDKSIVVIEKSPLFPRSSSPDRTIKGRSPRALASQNPRRRSMSVSEADLKKAMSPVATSDRLPTIGQKDWDTGSALDGVMKDFKGELSSQLDHISNSPLDLKYPITPVKEAKVGCTDLSLSDGAKRVHPPRPQFKMAMTPPTTTKSPPPTLTLDADVPIEEPIVPPRSSSLNSPLKKPNNVGTLGSVRTNPVKYGPRHPRPSASNSLSANSTLGRDSSRLRVQHRSTASSSEPSLIPIRDEDKTHDPKRTVRLVPSSPSVGWPEATAPGMSSQADLTEETGTSRVPSSTVSREDSLDLESRGKDAATKCWREDEEFLAKEKIAEWLGSTGIVNKVALRYYIDYFDFSGLRLDVAFRRLCAKLYLKAETQQVDRILEEFSRRYWETNPNTVYGSASVVHAVSYSLLLLNTDLHVAELAQRMSRSQFVRNTLSAIQMQMRPNALARASTPDLTRDDGSSVRGLGSDGSDTGGSTLRSRGYRSGSVTSWNSVSKELINTPATTPNSGTSQMQLNGSNTSVQESQAPQPRIKNASSTSVVYTRKFEDEMENLLKEMYSAIKQHQILQPLTHLSAVERASTSSLSPGPHHTLLRKRSLRGQNDRVSNLKRGSMRGIQTLFNAQGNSPYGLDGRISPSPSFATSTHESFAASSSFLPPTLGFASNLSHTIIRETREDDERSIGSDDTGTSSVSITDEELALLGAPWAKEGILCRKQYWESTNKRAKSKQWLDVFVVIQKGELNMFTFGGQGSGGPTMGVGGGNWLTNANSVGTVSLIHSLAHVLPPPGYSRQRPHCFVLTLASGGVYFFQAGTEELVNEWVSTCNYWAARLSKEPLAGGVSNMEYGWNRVVDIAESRPSASGDPIPARDPDPSDTLSMRSGRSGRSRMSKKDPFSLKSNGSPFSDRVFINEWKPPMPSTVASTHEEESQLEALNKHAAALKQELDEHNHLRMHMQQLYQPRSTNANKANTNWEKKSQYLLTEIVKYDSYVESLKAATALRLKKRGEKALEKALVPVSLEEEGGSSAKRWKGYPEGETIPEAEEPPLTPGLSNQGTSQHRRESAGVPSSQE